MTSVISRRAFVGALGGGLLAAPLAARAQQADRPRRIGVFLSTAANDPESLARISEHSCRDCWNSAGPMAAT